MPKKGEIDEIFEALVEACGGKLEELTRNERGKYNAAAKQLREVNATPAEVLRRARQYRYHHSDWALTPMALVSHWSEFARSLDQRTEAFLEEEIDQAALAREMDEADRGMIVLTPERLAVLRRSIGRTMD